MPGHYPQVTVELPDGSKCSGTLEFRSGTLEFGDTLLKYQTLALYRTRTGQIKRSASRHVKAAVETLKDNPEDAVGAVAQAVGIAIWNATQKGPPVRGIKNEYASDFFKDFQDNARSMDDSDYPLWSIDVKDVTRVDRYGVSDPCGVRIHANGQIFLLCFSSMEQFRAFSDELHREVGKELLKNNF